MAYCCGANGNRETIASKWLTVKFVHEQLVGRSLTLVQFRIKAVKKRIKTVRVERTPSNR